MKILVVSRISIPAKDRTLPAWEHLRKLGHEVIVEHPESVPSKERPDYLISMGVTVMDETFLALDRFPGVPLACYEWDTYAWVWEPGQEGKRQAEHASRPNEYGYVQYGDLLRRAREIWVPSVCTGRRVTQWWNLKNWRVILSACPWWDAPTRDDGYALCTLRHIPDPWDTMFEQCCAELGIPFMRTDHDLSYHDYQQAVANCRFLCSHYYEASTGGLTLLEGYRLGKPVLLSDSEWNGAGDYFGERAEYFQYGNKEAFKSMLMAMYKDPPKPPADCKQWIETNFSDVRMVEDMLRAMQASMLTPKELAKRDEP